MSLKAPMLLSVVWMPNNFINKLALNNEEKMVIENIGTK